MRDPRLQKTAVIGVILTGLLLLLWQSTWPVQAQTGTKVSGLVAYSTVHSDDLLLIVDVHDTTMASSGSDKKATLGQVLGGLTGDVTWSGLAGTVAKTGGVAFAPSATTDTTSASNISSGTLAAAHLPTTGLTITQAYTAIVAPADGSTVTFDLSAGNLFQPAAMAGNRTLALANAPTATPWARPFTLILTQDATGSRTVTWWSGIRWPSGTVPTLTTTASKSDAFAFIQIGNGAYLGFIVGQAL